MTASKEGDKKLHFWKLFWWVSWSGSTKDDLWVVITVGWMPWFCGLGLLENTGKAFRKLKILALGAADTKENFKVQHFKTWWMHSDF